MWNEQQFAATNVQQMERQQNQVMQQSLPIQAMMEQYQSGFDDTRMPLHTSHGESAQHLQSFYPTSTVETYDHMPNLMIQPLKQERYNEQMNDGHVEFIQQANSQFTPYNDQVNASGTMLPSTATNQSLVIGQLGVVNDQSNIEHNEMEQSFVLPRQPSNTSLSQRFEWATPQFPKVLGYMHNHPNLFSSISPKSQCNQQQLVQTPTYAQNPFQQCYNQIMVQKNDGVLQNSEEMVCDTTATAIKSHCIGRQPIMVASSIDIDNNGQAIISNQHEKQSTIFDHSDVSQTSTAQLPFSTEYEKSVVMPPVIIKQDESVETSIVQIHEDRITTIEDAATTSSVLFDEESTNDKNLPKALIKPQISTDAFGDFVEQKPDKPFFETASSSNSSDISDNTQNGESVQLDEPTSKIIKLEIVENNSNIEQMDHIDENNWENESSCSTTIHSDFSDDCSNGVQNINTYSPPELTFRNALTWTVKDVRNFINFAADCNEIADKFEYHEIDGEALMLLKFIHLVQVMKIKLGPALKLFATLNTIRAKI